MKVQSRVLRPCFHGLAVCFLSLLAPLAAEPVVVINELKSDTPGSDAAEFLELWAYDSASGAGLPHFPLDGYVVVFFNGGSPINAAYAVTPMGGAASASIELDGRLTNAAGFFVIGSPLVAGADLKLLPGASGWMQNGADAIGLYRNPSTAFTTTTGATAMDLVDAVVYGTDDPEDVDLLGVLTPGSVQINEIPNSVESMVRRPDGGAPFDSSVFAAQAPSPGSLNQPVEMLSLVPLPGALAEGGTREGVVSRSGPTTAAVTVILASSDPGEVAVPATVELPAGSASAAFLFTGVDDLWPDGDQTATITATAPGYGPTEIALSTADDGDAPQALVLNEVFAAGTGDANQDGANATSQDRHNDEFVEIVNRGATAADLGLYRLFTSSIGSVRHTFPPGTVLHPGGALVVFGGGAPALGMTEAFGTAWVQVANAPTLGTYLLEPAARLSLQNPLGQEVAGFEYAGQSGALDSVTLHPDLDGQPISHGSVGDGLRFFSPGTRADGAAFALLTAVLTPAIEPRIALENAGPAAATLTVRRPPPLTHPLVVSVLSNDSSEAVPAVPAFTIAAGQATGSVAVDLVDDSLLDGPQLVTFTVTAAGHLNGSVAFEIADDGTDIPPRGVFINEIDSDQSGPDTAEFVELYVGEPAARALDGFIVVFFNGFHATNGAYSVHDLSGRSSNSRGFFVLGNASVPNVDLIIPEASLQNGADAVAVYRAPAAAFTAGGTASPPTPEDLVDAVVYGNESGQDADLLAAFQLSGGPAERILAQYSEGSPNNKTALVRLPDATDGFGDYTAQLPTPGATNLAGPPGPPTIAIALAGGDVVITFTGRLEQSTSLLDESFVPVAGAVSPVILAAPAAGSRFFRAAAP